jgi:hypothetical protein
MYDLGLKQGATLNASELYGNLGDMRPIPALSPEMQALAQQQMQQGISFNVPQMARPAPQVTAPAMQPAQQTMGADPNGLLAQIMGEYVSNKKNINTDAGMLAQILSDRFKTNGEDVRRSVLQTAINPSDKGVSPQQASLERMQYELAPYSTMTELQSKMKTANANPGGATGELVDRWIRNAPGDREAIYAVQAGGLRRGMVMGPDGITPISGALPTVTAFSNAEQSGKNNAVLTTAQAIESAKTTGTEEAKIDAERKAGYAKALSGLNALKTQSNLVVNTIDRILGTPADPVTGKPEQKGLISPTSTNYGNLALSFLPGTDARALNNELLTIKANITTNALQTMRENSPTGGALGNVSDFENRLLQATNGALDPLEADQLVANLKIIRELYPIVMAEREKAFAADYGKYAPAGAMPPGAVTLPGGVPPTAGNRVRMIGPDGSIGTIDASEVQDALANGWKMGK